MKKLLLLTFAILATMNSFAQNDRKIKGSVLDEKSETIPYANVLLLKAKDSTLAKAATTDVDGNFIFEDFKDNQYLLKISMVGFKEFYSPKFFINSEKQSLDFGKINISPSENLLQAVNVTAKKPFIEQQLDKTVVNVENSIVASGNTLLEILEKSPGVVIDRQNNAIKLRNKE